MEPFVEVNGSNTGVPRCYFELKRWTDRYPELSVGFTSRIGGVSREPWQSLNVGLHVGDRSEDVVANRKRTAELAGFSFETWTNARQVHGDRTVVVSGKHRGQGRFADESACGDADALITRERDVMLTALFADCVPIYLYDPVRQAIGIAHAGWRGTADKTAGSAVRAMSAAFGSRSEQLLAAIGPSIGGCCYEVDEHLAGRFQAFEGTAVPHTGGKWLLDLKEINRRILEEAGILPGRIEMTRRCTGCDTEHFFSHRKENGRTGRMAAWIGLKKEVNQSS